MRTQPRGRRGRRILTGSALIAGGVLLMLDQSGLLGWLDLDRTWPVILIVFGIARLAITFRARRRRGWGWLLLGAWLLGNTLTDWTYVSWAGPALLTGYGALLVARSLLRRRCVTSENHLAV